MPGHSSRGGRFPSRRSGAQQLFVPPDAGRPDARRGIARRGMRGDSGRLERDRRPDGGGARRGRDRVYRHTPGAPDPARAGGGVGAAARVRARAGDGRRAAAVPAHPPPGWLRSGRLPGLRGGRHRADRVRVSRKGRVARGAEGGGGGAAARRRPPGGRGGGGAGGGHQPERGLPAGALRHGGSVRLESRALPPRLPRSPPGGLPGPGGGGGEGARHVRAPARAGRGPGARSHRGALPGGGVRRRRAGRPHRARRDGAGPRGGHSRAGRAPPGGGEGPAGRGGRSPWNGRPSPTTPTRWWMREATRNRPG